MIFCARISGYTALKPGKDKSKKQAKAKRKEQLEKICRSIGLLSARDVDSTAVEVFRYALVKRGKFFGSTELSRVSRINRLTCLYHLKRMEHMGVVKSRGGEYSFSHSSLREMIDEFRNNSLMMFNDIETSAIRVDNELEREHEERKFQKASARAKA